MTWCHRFYLLNEKSEVVRLMTLLYFAGMPWLL